MYNNIQNLYNIDIPIEQIKEGNYLITIDYKETVTSNRAFKLSNFATSPNNPEISRILIEFRITDSVDTQKDSIYITPK